MSIKQIYSPNHRELRASGRKLRERREKREIRDKIVYIFGTLNSPFSWEITWFLISWLSRANYLSLSISRSCNQVLTITSHGRYSIKFYVREKNRGNGRKRMANDEQRILDGPTENSVCDRYPQGGIFNTSRRNAREEAAINLGNTKPRMKSLYLRFDWIIMNSWVFLFIFDKSRCFAINA